MTTARVPALPQPARLDRAAEVRRQRVAAAMPLLLHLRDHPGTRTPAECYPCLRHARDLGLVRWVWPGGRWVLSEDGEREVGAAGEVVTR